MMRFLIALGAASVFAMGAAAQDEAPLKTSAEIRSAMTDADWRAIPADETLLIELESGTVTIALSPAMAPKHVEQLRKLTRAGFYDGLSFYRVIDGFVAQGGDPFGDKDIGKAKKQLKAEFEAAGDDIAFAAIKDVDGFATKVGYIDGMPAGYDEQTGTYWLLHCAGAFAFGRNEAADTASTEFYIAIQPQRFLDRNLTVFGNVIDGMEHVQLLRRVAPPETKDDDVGEEIIRMRMASDLPEAERPQWEILDSARPVFAALTEARRNRAEKFFIYNADHLDICREPLPVRNRAAE